MIAGAAITALLAGGGCRLPSERVIAKQCSRRLKPTQTLVNTGENRSQGGYCLDAAAGSIRPRISASLVQNWRLTAGHWQLIFKDLSRYWGLSQTLLTASVAVF